MTNKIHHPLAKCKPRGLGTRVRTCRGKSNPLGLSIAWAFTVFSSLCVLATNELNLPCFDRSAITMVKWFCSSCLCFNNHNSRDTLGQPIKFYRLPRDPEIQRADQSVLKTTGINWKNGHICSAHWSQGERKDTSDLPCSWEKI